MTGSCRLARDTYLRRAAEPELEPDASHLAGCGACRDARARAERFEARLTTAARAIAARPASSSRRSSMARVAHGRSLPVAFAGAALVVVLALMLGPALDAWVGERPGASGSSAPPSSAGSGSALPAEGAVRGVVLALAGAQPTQTLVLEDGVAAIAFDGTELSLVLVRGGASGAEGVELARMPLRVRDGSAITAGTVVVCPDLDAVRRRFVIGYFQSQGEHTSASLAGAEAIGGAGPEGTYLFALDPGPIDAPERVRDGPSVVVRGEGGVASFPAAWFEQPERLGTRTAAGCWTH